jgi:hypothetical protein
MSAVSVLLKGARVSRAHAASRFSGPQSSHRSSLGSRSWPTGFGTLASTGTWTSSRCERVVLLIEIGVESAPQPDMTRGRAGFTLLPAIFVSALPAHQHSCTLMPTATAGNITMLDCRSYRSVTLRPPGAAQRAERRAARSRGGLR